MTFQFLVSTMNQDDDTLLMRLNICGDAVIINQCGRNARKEIIYHGHTVLWIDTDEKGLSKSRNMALRNASADVCLVVDDDEVLFDATPHQVVAAFTKYQDATIIRFQVEGIERSFKTYSMKESEVNLKASGKLSSVEMGFRREQVINHNIWFDELIGAGTDLSCGEENAFAFACLRERLKIYYVPVCVAKVHMNESSWFTGVNEHYFRSRGAAFMAMSHKLAYFLIIRFAITHSHICRKIGYCKAVKYMMAGAEIYWKRKSENQ